MIGEGSGAVGEQPELLAELFRVGGAGFAGGTGIRLQKFEADTVATSSVGRSLDAVR
ncbi:hypothetical protein ACIGO9_20180 [Nocardia asteroides]|uniref:hypothetical protein n=1 Tax=Nocardia asteroides TaxID=1824 RepID=UPI0037C5777E